MKTDDITGGILPGKIMPYWSPISIGDRNQFYNSVLLGIMHREDSLTLSQTTYFRLFESE